MVWMEQECVLQLEHFYMLRGLVTSRREKGSGREMEMEKEKVGTDLYYRTYVRGGNRTWDTPHHTTHIMFTRSRSLSSSP
jgi:hypothetical protein